MGLDRLSSLPVMDELREVRPRAVAAMWVDRFSANNLLTYASAIALQLLVALAALVFLAVALIRPLGAQHSWRTQVVPVLSSHLPLEWLAAILWSAHREMSSSSSGLILFGAVILVWEMSGSVRAVMGALNEIYGVQERRSFGRRFLVSFALAALIGPMLVCALFLGAGVFQMSLSAVSVAEHVLLPALLIYLVVAALVLVAPARRQPWRWVSAGAVWIILAWLLVSAGFGYWISNAVNLRASDGALALALSLVGYLYASAIAFLIGAQLDQIAREGGPAAVFGVERA